MICFKLIYTVYLILWCTHACIDFIYIYTCGWLCASWCVQDIILFMLLKVTRRCVRCSVFAYWHWDWDLTVRVAHGVEPRGRYEPLQSKMILRWSWHDDILLCLSTYTRTVFDLIMPSLYIISDCFRILINLLSFISSYPCSCVFHRYQSGRRSIAVRS